ncbi:ERG20 farnesyl diphosphate synthase [Hypomontagnella monticulosa]|nr:ERG20 farnesyl diphosphate synthase [Hypomontagnella monticulosa]
MPASLDEFKAIFPTLLEDLRKQCCEQYELPIEVWQWFEKSLNYNTLGGKCNRGLSVVDTTQLLFGRDLTPGEYFDAAALGWMIELLQAMMLVLDDIMDSSKTRRNQPCWYLVPDVGMVAVNDAPALGSAIYILLKKYFKGHPAYVDMFELFQEVSFQIELGQTLDMLVAPQDRVELDKVNLDKYTSIVTFKTAYYSFYLPVAIALLYTDKASPQNLTQARGILIPMGQYFQVQDDYLDVYADPSVFGKIGTDIQDNKQANYGRKSEQCEQMVKGLYNELGLDKVYRDFEEAKVAGLRQKIDEVDETQGLKKEIFEEFLRKIYRRTK